MLKINDDRKVHINLGGIKEPGTMLMLTVRQFDVRGKPPAKEGEFDRAWFRLSNEETNQTIDYSLVNKIEMPEEYQEFIPAEGDDEEAPPEWNALTFFHGVLYLEEQNGYKKWVFESFKKAFQSKDYPDTAEMLGKIYNSSIKEYNE